MRTIMDMKFVILGLMFVIAAVIVTHQTTSQLAEEFSILEEVIMEVSEEKESLLPSEKLSFAVGLLGAVIGAGAMRISLGLALAALGIGVSGWGFTDYAMRSNTRSMKILGGMIKIDVEHTMEVAKVLEKRLVKIEKRLNETKDSKKKDKGVAL